MAKPPKLTVKLSAVTPLFIGGADPNDRAELRPPSIKGLLRYWYRALDGNYATTEARFFGSTDAGQSPCLLRVGEWTEGKAAWERERYARPEAQGGFQRGSGTQSKNGIIYLGYSLTLGDNRRKAVPADTTFTLEVQPRPESGSSELRHAWLGALWLLVHVGGIGTRSRRGLGSLRIDEWDGWSECDELPLPCQAATPAEWKTRFERALRALMSRYRTRPSGHTAVAHGLQALLIRNGHARERDVQGWERALDDAGLRMQQFRQRKDPDYSGMKAAVVAKQPTVGPERAGFGLPLAFRYTSMQGASLTVSAADGHDRMASPLFIRVVKLGDRYHAGYVYLPAPPVARREGLRLEPRGGPAQTVRWHPEAATVVTKFLKERVQPDAVGVIWS